MSFGSGYQMRGFQKVAIEDSRDVPEKGGHTDLATLSLGVGEPGELRKRVNCVPVKGACQIVDLKV